MTGIDASSSGSGPPSPASGQLAPRNRRALLLLVILVLAWQTATSLRARLTSTDEIAFKAAGREWAQSGHFAAPELIGFRHLEPPAENVWFGQMPVYTFLFGVVAKLFGFGAWQSQLYDTLIHGLLCLTTFWIARARFPETPPWTACLAGALLLPLAAPGRADELAAILGSIALLVALGGRPSPARYVAAGLVAGLCAATSPAAAVLMALVAVGSLAADRSPLWRDPTFGLLATTAAVVGFGVGLLPPLLQDPDSWRQMARHGSEEIGHGLAWGLGFSWQFGKPQILGLASGLVVAAAALPRGVDSSRNWRTWCRAWLGPLLAIGLTMLVFPAKYYYGTFVLPWAFAAALPAASRLTAARRWVALALSAGCYLAAVVPGLALQAVMWTLPPAQTLAYNVAQIRQRVPPGATVYAQEYWSSLANDVRFVSMAHGHPDLAGVDFVLLDCGGSGTPGAPAAFPNHEYFDHSFESIYDNLPRQPPTLLGRPISHSAWGFGVRILARRSSAIASSPAPRPTGAR